MAELGRLDHLHKLQQIETSLHQLSSHWTAHMTLVSQTLDHGSFPVIQPTTSIEAGMLHLRSVVDFFSVRVEALDPMGFPIMPIETDEYLMGLLRRHMRQEAVGLETVEWQLKRAMGKVEDELDSWSTNVLSMLEGKVTEGIKMCNEMLAEAIATENSAAFQRAVAMVEDVRRRRGKSSVDGGNDLLSQEEASAEKMVAVQEQNVLEVLCGLSARGREMPRQMLIDEFFGCDDEDEE